MKAVSEAKIFVVGRRAMVAAALCVGALAALPGPTAASEVARAVPAAWRGEGRWGWHDGRWGWWWIGPAGVWTWYAFNPYWGPYGYPYYPYPYYYGYPYPGPESNLPLSNMPAPPQYWYYCDAAKGYYPNVATCPGGWRPVPAVPEAPAGTPSPSPGKQ